MNYPGAIVVAAGIVAGAVLLNGQGLSQMNAGSYAITPSTQGPLSVWRVDSTTGAVSLCITGVGTAVAPSCSPWSKDAAAPAAPKN